MWKLLTATLAQLLVTKDQTLSALVGPKAMKIRIFMANIEKDDTAMLVDFLMFLNISGVSGFGSCTGLSRMGWRHSWEGHDDHSHGHGDKH
ncbi:hypothetical protein Godav_008909 [Gossypium davidsonii]|uniref:Uncharacterized protein n=1 Tax=Gossypium davidsonii TaxID=34287 RepID=A0A7J8SBF9_GOSDV|nr:hypothetical protein [Gossypium davidsonii]